MKKTKFLALLMSATIALNIAPVYAVESAERMTIEQEITIEKTATNNVKSTDYKYSVDGGYIYFNESTKTITGADTSITSANIPSTINGVSVTSIGDVAFSGCSSLTSITIPNSVTSIGMGAFYECSSLTTITIPNSVTSIGQYAFNKCENLTSITIPNSVTSIGEYAFRYCENLTSITIPNSVTSIEDRAFSECYGLTSITIPNSVTSIGDRAFYECSSLTSITIPNSVTSIEYGAFAACSSLTSITIPNSVTSIGSYAFNSCTSLTDVYYTGSQSQWNSISIDDGNSFLTNATIHYDSNLPQTTITVADKYSDINTSDWHYSAMEFAVNEGLLSGTSETILSPNGTTSKAMIWTILYRYAGGQGVTTGANWYDEPQNWVVSNDLSNDINNPLDAMTREDLATMLYKIEGSPSVSGDYTSSFSDSSSISTNAKTAMNWAIHAGLYKGNDSNTLNPTNSLTRAEVATIFMRYMSN